MSVRSKMRMASMNVHPFRLLTPYVCWKLESHVENSIDIPVRLVTYHAHESALYDLENMLRSHFDLSPAHLFPAHVRKNIKYVWQIVCHFLCLLNEREVTRKGAC